MFKARSSANTVVDEVRRQEFAFPLIAKPDIGMRGLQVKKITSFAELADYCNKSKVDFLVQQYIAYENEVGIFITAIPENSAAIFPVSLVKNY